MFAAIGSFFGAVKEARYGFGDIWSYLVTFYYTVTENPTVSAIWNAFMGAIAPAFAIVMILVILFSVSVSLFGQRMIGALKFMFFFVIGFVIGVQLLAPVIPEGVRIPPWIVGLVVALITSVLYRFLYIGLYSVVVGYSVYILCYNGFFLIATPEYTTFRAILCLVVSLVVLGLSFLLKKYIEMIFTSILGGWYATMIFIWYIYNFTRWPFLVGREWVGIFIMTALIASIGLFVQFKTRRRY